MRPSDEADDKPEKSEKSKMVSKNRRRLKAKNTNRKAGFKRGVKPKKSKKVKKVCKKDGNRDAEPRTFLGYDISMLPRESWPDDTRPNRGKHSYTLTYGGASIEVLLQKEAFFVKKVDEDGSGPTGQVTWGRHGGAREAWKIAKQRAGFSRYS